MAIILNKLVARGMDREDVDLHFAPKSCLIRGPSDTGKSYIRDSLWYLLGGEKVPKLVPEAEGYQTIALEFSSGEDTYIVQRALAGGSAEIYKRRPQEVNADASSETPDAVDVDDHRSSDAFSDYEPLNVDLAELIVRLSGAAGKQLLRSKSKRGDVTGGDLRHWFLLSQPAVISEDPTSGASHSDRPQRIAAFHLFLTGNDDSAIALAKSKAEKDRITGELTSAQDGLRRAQAGIPPDTTRKDVADALDRVDNTLTEMARQYDARATSLKEVRKQIVNATDALRAETARMNHSAAMVERFELLADKYNSDLERLGAVNEGVAYFQTLDKTPCPLCGAPTEQHTVGEHVSAKAAEKYRTAVAAEVNKIRSLRSGLIRSLAHERSRLESAAIAVRNRSSELKALEEQELRQLNGARIEFAGDPKSLAIRRTELSAVLNSFDEVERLKAEIERLKNSKVSRTAPISREAGQAAVTVAGYAKTMLHAWGFSDIKTVRLDASECDLIINERARLSYGAGKRGLFLTALTVALLQHSMTEGFPHLGAVVIDSPLKAYADLDSPASNANDNDNDIATVPLATVKDNFYAWLAQWNGPGQIIILENEKISDETAAILKPIQFTRRNDKGRAGFYLKSIVPLTSDE